MPNSVFYGGQFAVPNQAIGDLLVANTIQSWTGLPDVAAGAILQSGGVGAAPSYTTKPNIVSTLNAATGNEVAFTIAYTVNKATSGNDTGLLIAMTDTASPGTSLPLNITVDGSSKFSVTSSGTVTIAAGLTVTSGNVITSASGVLGWSGLTRMTAPLNGQVLLRNQATTAGVLLDFTTDATLKVRDRAGSADADLTAKAGTFSGAVDGTGYKVSGVAGTASATFTSQDGKTVTVTGGLVTSVV